MLQLIGVAVSIGLADSLNPSTIGPALYLATLEHGLGQVLRFTAGAVRALQAPASEEYVTGHLSMIRREPHGVIGAVTPWKSPGKCRPPRRSIG